MLYDIYGQGSLFSELLPRVAVLDDLSLWLSTFWILLVFFGACFLVLVVTNCLSYALVSTDTTFLPKRAKSSANGVPLKRAPIYLNKQLVHPLLCYLRSYFLNFDVFYTALMMNLVLELALNLALA